MSIDNKILNNSFECRKKINQFINKNVYIKSYDYQIGVVVRVNISIVFTYIISRRTFKQSLTTTVEQYFVFNDIIRSSPFYKRSVLRQPPTY